MIAPCSIRGRAPAVALLLAAVLGCGEGARNGGAPASGRRLPARGPPDPSRCGHGPLQPGTDRLPQPTVRRGRGPSQTVRPTEARPAGRPLHARPHLPGPQPLPRGDRVPRANGARRSEARRRALQPGERLRARRADEGGGTTAGGVRRAERPEQVPAGKGDTGQGEQRQGDPVPSGQEVSGGPGGVSGAGEALPGLRSDLQPDRPAADTSWAPRRSIPGAAEGDRARPEAGRSALPALGTVPRTGGPAGGRSRARDLRGARGDPRREVGVLMASPLSPRVVPRIAPLPPGSTSLAAGIALLTLASSVASPAAPARPDAPAVPAILFNDVTAAAGLGGVLHTHGGTRPKHYIETGPPGA